MKFKMEEYLMHYGIKNQKWGIRRFQNEDGSLTPAGRKRYGIADKRLKNREDYITERYSVDRLAARLGTSENIMNAGQVDFNVKKVRDLNASIRSSDGRMIRLGKSTIGQRVGIAIGGTTAAAGAAFAGKYLTGSWLVGGLSATAIAAGALYLEDLTTR